LRRDFFRAIQEIHKSGGVAVNVEGNKDIELDDDDDVIEDPEETVVLTEVDDDDDDLSETVVGLDVDAIVAKMESSNAAELARKRAAKKRLEELRERLEEDDEFGSTYAFDIDDDLPA
jgi:hypothetical protein